MKLENVWIPIININTHRIFFLHIKKNSKTGNPKRKVNIFVYSFHQKLKTL